MTKETLLKRVEELEKRICELEKRPQYIPCPVFQPQTPLQNPSITPSYPWWQSPPVIC